MPDPFAEALHDFHFDELAGPLLARDGEATSEHPIEDFYFHAFEGDDWLDDRLEGPLLDVGAGAGRHALYYQAQFDTTAIEPQERLVDVLRDRGVADARAVDMFDLPSAFDPDTFAAVIVIGTQAGLAASVPGLRQFLVDLATVTTPDATAVLDGYDPGHERTTDVLGYREDHAGAEAFRVLQFEYDGRLGDPLLFRLFSPDDVRDATEDTPWTVSDLRYGEGDWTHTYNVRLEKQA